MNRDLFVYFSIPGPSPEGCMAYGSVQKLISAGIIGKDDWGCHCNNVDSLAKVYNDILKDDRVKGKILVLIHSDVVIDDLFVKEKLNARFDRSRNAVAVGIAGGGKISLNDRPLELWHLMSVKESRMGEVTNTTNENDILAPLLTTRFGQCGHRAIIIDGCFIAIDVDRLLARGVSFDEDCPSKFNFYDLNFSLRCMWANAEIYVDPIRILHKSVGLTTLTDDFVVGNLYFKNNYMSRLRAEYGKKQ